MLRNSLWRVVVATLILSLHSHSVAAIAESKLRISITKTHAFLNGYIPGDRATLGDEWTLRVKVIDDDGDPASGSQIRIYRAKKSLVFARANSKGIAILQLPITKLGVNSLRIVAKDDDPQGSGELLLNFEVENPILERNPVAKPEGFYKNSNQSLSDLYAVDISFLISKGCSRYWSIEPQFWPFAESDEIPKWGFTRIPRADQAKIDPLLSDTYKGWSLHPSSEDGSPLMIICDLKGRLVIFNR
jgi:hypothetical protein